MDPQKVKETKLQRVLKHMEPFIWLFTHNGRTITARLKDFSQTSYYINDEK